MPLLADRVRETTTTTGQGTLTLDGAPSGFRTFSGAFGNAVSVYYVIAGPSEWEIGIGTTGAGTLTRDTVLVSSAGGTTKVTFSAGTKDVFCSYVADRAVTTSDAATLTNKTIDDYTNNVGANSTHFRIKASGTLSKGTVVKAVGFTPGESAIEVAATSSASDVALGICEQALTTGQFGLAVVIGELFDVNTNGLSVGATLYSNNAGGYTTTKPSSGLYQALGWVVRANTNNGVIAVNIVAPLYVETSTNTANTAVLRDGSGNFAAGTITAALTGNASTASALTPGATINGVTFTGASNITVAAAAGTLTGSTLASGVTASSLTSVGTLTSLTVSGNLTVDTNTLAVDAANNRVGIRNATPGSAFHIGSTVATGGIADSNFTANVTGSSNTLLGIQDAVIQGYIQAAGTVPEMRVGTYTAHDLAFYTANIARARFTAAGAFSPSSNTNIVLSGSGKFGTDGNTPAYSFHAGTTAVPVTLTQQAVFSNATQGGMSVTDGTRQLTMVASAGAGCALATLTADDLRFFTSNTERWRIGASTGHLLAGTDNTYDIGASGATRPRDLFIGRNADHGGWMRAGAASAGAASTTTFGNGTATTVGASGAADALPANPLGYIIAHVGTTQVKIPYYTA